ncbi:MAG: thiol-activated cytolysin family protein [Thiohalomonadales bacterium]
MMNKYRNYFIISLTTVSTLFFVACSGGGGGGTGAQADDVSGYLRSLPSWSEFSPPLKSAESIGDPVDEAPVTLDVEEIQENGKVVTKTNTRYLCQSQPVTLTGNPEKIVMLSPDLELLWPGALIQGKSHRDGQGSLLGLTIAQRSAIEVSIPGLNNNDNFRRVENPTQATVQQARGSMIGAATLAGLSTPSSIFFKMETYHSEKAAALSMGLSGNYLGFEASATGSVAKNASKTTITAQFYQKMFEVVVAPPQTPDAFFSDAFAGTKLQEQIDLGNIGRDNLPVYVSNVVYGRLMMFSMTSTASEKDIRATMQAAYESIGAGIQVNMSLKQKSILRNSEIKITSLGGNAQATITMIKTGNWADYFTDNAELTSASPLTYTFRNLGDGSIASVSETTNYNIKTCQAIPATPGTFNFEPMQSLGLPISVPATSVIADVNGDQHDDIIWNSLTPTANETIVALSNGDGTFAMQTGSILTHTAVPADLQAGSVWNDFTMQVGDFNNDGRDDLAWSKPSGIDNVTYIVLSNPNDAVGVFTGYTEKPALVHPGNWGQSLYEFKVGNIDKKNGDDLIWNRHSGTTKDSGNNRTYVSLSNGDGSFKLAGTGDDHPASANLFNNTITWNLEIGDVDNSGTDDLIWYSRGYDYHLVFIGLSKIDSKGKRYFDFTPNFSRATSRGWVGYYTVIGDVDGLNGIDLVWVNSTRVSVPIHRDLATGSGNLTIGPLQNSVDKGPADGDKLYNQGPFDLHMLDVNGDGRDDLLLNTMNNTANVSYLGLGTADGLFNFGRIEQKQSAAENWSLYTILTGDFNGDGRDDILYNNADVTNKIYVGLAK